MPIKVFWTEPTEFVDLALRRYRSSDENNPDAKCPGKYGYHNAHFHIGPHKARYSKSGRRGHKYLASWEELFKGDDRWPTVCDHCAYEFLDTEPKQIYQDQIYRRVDTGEEILLKTYKPAGMMWNAWWMGKWSQGSDGICLQVQLPDGGEWGIDGRASNCDSPCKICSKPYNQHDHGCCNPDDTRPHNERDNFIDAIPKHKCWVRHGDPKTGVVRVDKNGLTCGAGQGRQGSIRRPGFSGYLHDGYLITEEEYASQTR